MEEERSRLADLIEKHAISYSNEPFTLASGAKSNFYFDLRQVSGDAEGITAIARLLYNMITEIGGIKSVGGLESGSISLAAAISQYSYTKNPSSPLTSFYVRKQAKSHGAKKRIEGRPQSPVAIVDAKCDVKIYYYRNISGGSADVVRYNISSNTVIADQINFRNLHSYA